jgi:hypothetical protein
MLSGQNCTSMAHISMAQHEHAQTTQLHDYSNLSNLGHDAGKMLCYIFSGLAAIRIAEG